VGVFIAVAFLTLVERKIIRYFQYRKGPNKISIYGVLQPFADALKLFSKSFKTIKLSKFFYFSIAPTFGVLMITLMWIFYPRWTITFRWNLEIILFFSILGLISYFLFFCGFSTSRTYSIIGYIRSVAQTISYEVCVILFILWLVYIFSNMTLYLIIYWERGLRGAFFFPRALFLWMFLRFSESNRTPFDFSEGESEIVSGFNIEYFGGEFSIIFIVEYGIIIFISFIRTILFFSSTPLIIMTFLISSIYIWSRRSFPRFRYDKLIEASWLRLTPLIVTVLLLLMEASVN